MAKISKTIRRISILLGFIIALLPLPVFAQENSGIIHIEQTDADTKKTVEGISLTLYQVAIVDENGGRRLTEDFLDTNLNPENLGDKETYNQNVQFLDRYIEKKQLSGNTKVTERDGVAEYTGLPDGVYFIKQTNVQEDFDKLGYSYDTDSYLVILPWTGEDGTLTRTVRCKPKGKIVYPEKKKNIVVHKVWKDDNDRAGERPDSISVGLYCDERLQQKVTLNASNNWTYQWKNLDSDKKWKVKELDVPEGYISEVTSEGNIYTVTNKWTPSVTPGNPGTPGNPHNSEDKKRSSVKTGDSTDIVSWIYMTAGAAVICLGILLYRKKKKD